MATQSDPGAERKTTQRKRQARPTFARPSHDGTEVFALTTTLVVNADARTDAPKIETHRRSTRRHERARDGMDHFVGERAAE
jgi:ribosomal protein L16/L10AE